MKKFSLILANNNRSLLYLKYLIKQNLLPKEIIFLSKKKNRKFNFKILKNVKLKYLGNDINSKKICDYITNSDIKYFIYSGYASILIKSKKLLNSKTIIHAHSGRLPEYKGSTAIFYSILEGKSIFCTVLRLTKEIDNGKIFFIKKFKIKSSNLNSFDSFDNKIRIKSLIHVIKTNFKYKKIKKIKNEKYLDYHVAHPLIRALARERLKMMHNL